MYCRMLGLVFDIRTFSLLQTFIHQSPDSARSRHPEGHREDVPPPVLGVAAPDRVQDPHYVDVAYQGIVDYHPQPLVGVSNTRTSATKPPFDQWHRTPHMYSPMSDSAKVSQLKHIPMLQ